MNTLTNSKVKRISSVALALALLFTSIPMTSKAANAETKLEVMTENAEQEAEDLIDAVDENLNISEDGLYDITETKINKLVDSMNLDDIIKTYAHYGMKITEQDLIDMLITNIEDTNEQIEDGELLLLENGTLIESNDNEFYLEGGKTKKVNKWWGVRMYKSTTDANAWIRTLQKGVNANNAAAVIAGAATSGVWAIGAIPNALFAWYLGDMAADASYHNSRGKNGIIVDIRFIISYKITKQ